MQTTQTKLIPLFDRVILKPLAEEKKLASGLIIPSSAADKPRPAKVIAIGNGITDDGRKIDMAVKIGDIVIYSVYAGVEFISETQTFILIKQTDILAIVKENENE